MQETNPENTENTEDQTAFHEEDFSSYDPPFNAADQVKFLEKAEGVARSYHWIFLGATAYSVTTYFTTNDKSILINDEIELPLIGLPVPSWAFFFLTPILLFGICMYFHLALNRVLIGIDKLVQSGDQTAEFRPLWVITRNYYDHLLCPPEERSRRRWSWIPFRDRAPEDITFRGISQPIVFLFLWIPLPGALLMNFVQQAKIHSPFHSIFSNLMIILGLGTIYYFRKRYLRRRIVIREVLFYITLFVIFCSGIILSGTITDSDFSRYPNRIREMFCLDVSNTIITQQPKQDYPEIPWLVLSNRNLNGIAMENSILIRTDFRNSSLKNANLRKTYLFQTDLRGVTLEGADLREAILDRSNLSGLQLTGMDLTGVSFKGANLTQTNFSNSNLTNANFEGAIVRGLRFDQACLKGANLNKIPDPNEQFFQVLQSAKSLDNATLDPALKAKLERYDSQLFYDFDPQDAKNGVVFWNK